MIGLIFKLTLCVRLLLVYKRLLSFFQINAFINVYYNFFDVYHIYVDNNFCIFILKVHWSDAGCYRWQNLRKYIYKFLSILLSTDKLLN